MQYCLICNPDGNGTSGEDGTEAIAKYYVENIQDKDQITTGWHALCEGCTEYLQGTVDITPLDGHENHPLFSDDADVTHECDDPTWTKESLVTEDGGFDWVRCDNCNIWAKRYGMNQIQLVGETRDQR